MDGGEREREREGGERETTTTTTPTAAAAAAAAAATNATNTNTNTNTTTTFRSQLYFFMRREPSWRFLDRARVLVPNGALTESEDLTIWVWIGIDWVAGYLCFMEDTRPFNIVVTTCVRERVCVSARVRERVCVYVWLAGWLVGRL